MFSIFGKSKPKKQMKSDDSEIDLKRLKTISTEIKPYEDIMIGFASALKEQKNVENRIEILKSLIESYYDLKRKCASLGHTCTEYFSDMWEHCHNSQNKDFCYIDSFEEELKELLSKKDELIAEQALHEKEKVYLKERVKSIIKSNSPILQTDVYKEFDPIVQSDISEIIYFMAKDGKIVRKKDGRSYIITWLG